MNRAAAEPRQFRLSVALAISAALHAVALLVFWALVLMGALFSRPEAKAEVPEETLLHFTFANEAETTATEPEQAAGVPVPEEPVRPSPTPPDFEPEGTPSLETPSSAGIPLEPEPVAPPRETPDPSDSADDEVEEAAALPVLDGETATRDAPQSRDAGAESPASRLDLDRALRDFGDAVTRAREARPQEPGSGRARNVFQPEPASFPASGFGAGNLTFESRDYDWSDYARQIYTALWQAWHNRLYETTEEFEKWAHQNSSWYLRHWTQARFVIERNGDVTEISVETPSGCLPLDQSAYDALQEVILPQLPADFPRDREVVHVRFIANGPIQGMRPTLTRLKQMGLF
jgi:hypothetical protein